MVNFIELDSLLLRHKGKIIHQIWFTGIVGWNRRKKLYKTLEKCRESWKKHNPDWFVIEWNNKMAMDFIKNIYPEHLQLYKKYKYEIQRCDAVRYFILYRYGGLYVDMDYYCNKSWTEVCKEYSGNLYIVQTPNREGEYISNSLIYSEPNNLFWKHVLIKLHVTKDKYKFIGKHLHVMFSTGPGFLNTLFQHYKYTMNLKIYPSKVFQPYGTHSDINKIGGEEYSIHLSQGSWHSNDSFLFYHTVKNWTVIVPIIVIFICLLVYLSISPQFPIDV